MNDVTKKSPATDIYNCVAFAAEEQDVWWWPDAWYQYYWPATAPRNESIAAFVAAFETVGFAPVDANGAGTKTRIALFSRDARTVSHVCREVGEGRWVSKLGRAEDVEHGLNSLGEYQYGSVHMMLARRRSGDRS